MLGDAFEDQHLARAKPGIVFEINADAQLCHRSPARPFSITMTLLAILETSETSCDT
jgi:hypothetical protein